MEYTKIDNQQFSEPANKTYSIIDLKERKKILSDQLAAVENLISEAAKLGIN